MNPSCKFQFFMAWKSSLESWREFFFTIESLFKSHPNACPVIVLDSLDSSGGIQLLSPFGEKRIREQSRYHLILIIYSRTRWRKCGFIG